MNQRTWKWLVGVLALVFLLAACGTQEKGGNGSQIPQMNRAGFDQSVQEYKAGVMSVAANLGEDEAVQALMNIPGEAPGVGAFSLGAALAALGPQTAPQNAPGLLSAIMPLVDQDLERGKYDYDEANGWESDPSYQGDDLVLTWSFDDDQGDPHLAELTFDWNYGAGTVDARDRDGSTIEMPQDMLITFKVDSQEVGSLHGEFAWYSCNGTPIAEPTSVSISGYAGAGDRVELTFNLSISDTRVSSSGSFSVRTGGDSASFEWDVWAEGTLNRDASCFISGFDVSSGHIYFKTTEAANGESHSYEFNTDFVVNFDDSGEPESADLTNGFIKVDGTLAVAFSGTLDDANHNCVPGENVTLVFADRTTTLEQYLIDQGVRPECPSH